MIGILSALPLETHCLKAHTTSAQRILFSTTGMGAKNAREGALHLLAQGASALVSWGVAGGLAPSITVGQLLIPDNVLNQQANSFSTDTIWRNQLQEILSSKLIVCDEPLLQADQMVISADAKRALFLQYQAAGIDMESAAIAEVAYEAGLPFVALRAIVDPASLSLPHWFPKVFSPEFKLQPLKFSRELCTNPDTWSSLVHLYRNLAIAKRSLSLAAKICFDSRFF